MSNEIIPYLEMCRREGASLQQGMNFHIGAGHSVILMSVRPNAPYRDQVIDDGATLIYEGHDVPKNASSPSPKSVDQPETSPNGNFTQNGKFHSAAQEFKVGVRQAERVRVYEKIRTGIWSDNGVFDLVDSWREHDGRRMVFKFKLVATQDLIPDEEGRIPSHEPRRLIPKEVKLEVWKRDGGKCVQCGANDELHFDHIIPFSRGGTSLRAENIQLLCARHNIAKRDRIE